MISLIGFVTKHKSRNEAKYNMKTRKFSSKLRLFYDKYLGIWFFEDDIGSVTLLPKKEKKEHKKSL